MFVTTVISFMLNKSASDILTINVLNIRASGDVKINILQNYSVGRYRMTYTFFRIDHLEIN